MGERAGLKVGKIALSSARVLGHWENGTLMMKVNIRKLPEATIRENLSSMDSSFSPANIFVSPLLLLEA